MNKTLSLTFFLLVFISKIAVTQSLTPSLLACTGNYGLHSEYSVSYSLGELAITTCYNSGYYLTQGFQQSYPNETPGPDTVPFQFVDVNPNPAVENLNIDFFISESNNFLVEIYNLKGSKIKQTTYSEITYGNRKSLNVGNLPKGLYFIHITSTDGKISEMFKIVKI